MSFKMDTSKLNLDLAAKKVLASLELYANTAAQKLEADAKEKAGWTDRTSQARNSIQGSSGWDGDKLKVVVSANTDYAPYLELANEKQYAILKPTVDADSPEIIRGFQKLVKD